MISLATRGRFLQHELSISIGYIEKETTVSFYSVLIKSMEQADIGFNIIVFFKARNKRKKQSRKAHLDVSYFIKHHMSKQM